MGKKIIIIGFIFLMVGLPLKGIAQYSIGGGVSTFLGLNVPTKRFGFNLFGEFPRSRRNTFTIRATYMLPVKNIEMIGVSAKEAGISPAFVNAERILKTTYFAIDGGTRYYFINDYDIGFALFAGGYLKGILSSYSATYNIQGDHINPNNYVDPNGQALNNIKPSFSALFAFGGMVGVKYNIPGRGAIVFDLGLEIISRLMDPYGILGREISPLSMQLNLAYRFDWY